VAAVFGGAAARRALRAADFAWPPRSAGAIVGGRAPGWRSRAWPFRTRSIPPLVREPGRPKRSPSRGPQRAPPSGHFPAGAGPASATRAV